MSIEEVRDKVIDLLDEVDRREYGLVGRATQQRIAVLLGEKAGFVYRESWTFVTRAAVAVSHCADESGLVKVRDILKNVLDGCEAKETLLNRVQRLEELVQQREEHK